MPLKDGVLRSGGSESLPRFAVHLCPISMGHMSKSERDCSNSIVTRPLQTRILDKSTLRRLKEYLYSSATTAGILKGRKKERKG